MKKIAALMMMLCILMTACASEETTEATTAAPTTAAPTTAAPTTAATEAPATEAEGKTVSPMPETLDLETLDNCTVNVSFEEGDVYVDDSGIMQMDAQIYTYEFFDMVDIASLEAGDIIVINGEEVKVETVEQRDNGSYVINGGIEEGGVELATDDSGMFFEIGMNDVKSWKAIGEKTIRVHTDMLFNDAADPENEKTFYPGDFVTDEAGIEYDFRPENTQIVIEDGQIIAVNRIYNP